MPTYCIVCKKPSVAGSVTMHRFPSNTEKRQQWWSALNLRPEEIKSHHCVCSRHFRNGNTSNPPSLNLGEKFRSPKMSTPRGLRAKKRQKLSMSPTIVSPSPSPVPSVTSTPISSDVTDDDLIPEREQMTTCESESLVPDFNIVDLPDQPGTSRHQLIKHSSDESSVIVNKALLARIEVLEAELKRCQIQLQKQKPRHFRIENIASNDSLISFYTGFPSYEVFLCFFEFLGPSVHSLNYWGDKDATKGKRKKKLDPKNQLFLTLMKLRQNPKERDLAFRFGVSVSTVSKYFIACVCFLYSHLKEVEWMPDVEQVKSTLPLAFKESYSNTYTNIDASEILVETPTDLQLQSSTWSNYKHHNTAKVLVACTPNGAVNFVSELYVGAISDVELKRICGLIHLLDGKQNISVMADRGFTIRDQLSAINVGLQHPPFHGRESTFAK